MTRIFIAYDHRDRETADSLRRALESNGFDCWWFDENIGLGQNWSEEIYENLRNADALVAIVSSNSSQSQWLNREVEFALSYSKEEGSPVVIPVFDGPIENFSGPLSRIQGIAIEGSYGDTADLIGGAVNLAIARRKAQEDKRIEVQRHVESSAESFIQSSLAELKESEKTYRRIAYIWYNLAYLTLLISVGFGVWRALIVGPTSQDWQSLVELAISGVIVIGLLVALAKYAFTLGKSFMVEALRNADRRHAISFGEFYLRAYGAKAEWSEVKDAFQHWNIDKGSHFLGQDNSEFDPKIFNLAVEMAKAATAKNSGK